MIRLGVHCSLKKGLCGALLEARRVGCESLQIFTRSPRMWRMRMPAPDEVMEFVRLRAELGLYPLAVHTPYLPNLATGNKALYERSCRALEEDLVVMEQLKADYLVIHPGAWSPDSSPEQGIGNIARAIRSALGAVPGDSMVLLENVAGGGRRLGSSFEELAAMLRAVGDAKRSGVCLDTAHALGAGFDVSSPEGIEAMFSEFDRSIGLERLKMFHLNDSLVPRGSRKDRHQHVGKGCIGTRGFSYLLKHIPSAAAAGILETPKDTPSSDRNNLRALFRWRARLQGSRACRTR